MARGSFGPLRYVDTYMKICCKSVFPKKFLFAYLLTKMYAISQNFRPWKFLKNFFHFLFLLWPISKQPADIQKNVEGMEQPAIDPLRLG